MSARTLAWAAIAAAGIAAAAVLARQRMQRRDALVAGLARQLAEAREQNGVLRERVEWFTAATLDRPPMLRLAQPRPEARRTAR